MTVAATSLPHARVLSHALTLAALALCCSPARGQDDPTLEQKAYVEQGWPAPDRPWQGADYAAAVAAARKLAPLQLPASRSPRSRAYVDRAVNPENLEPCENRELPLQQRLGEALGVLQGFSDLLKVYVAALQEDPSRGLDVARISAYGVRCAAVVLALSHELVPTLDKEDPTYPRRLAGLEQMRRGLAQLVNGAITMLEADLEPEARLELARALGEFFPRFVPDLPELTRAEMTARLQRMADGEQDEQVKASLQRALPQ